MSNTLDLEFEWIFDNNKYHVPEVELCKSIINKALIDAMYHQIIVEKHKNGQIIKETKYIRDNDAVAFLLDTEDDSEFSINKMCEITNAKYNLIKAIINLSPKMLYSDEKYKKLRIKDTLFVQFDYKYGHWAMRSHHRFRSYGYEPHLLLR